MGMLKVSRRENKCARFEDKKGQTNNMMSQRAGGIMKSTKRGIA